MKCKVRLMRAVELIVEGKSEEEIQDWLNQTTPEGAYLLADGAVDEHYEEEIVCTVKDNTEVNYTIQK